jgi:hypothetical protein
MPTPTKKLKVMSPKVTVKQGTPPVKPSTGRNYVNNTIAKVLLDETTLQPLSYIEVTDATRATYSRIKKALGKRDVIVAFQSENGNAWRGTIYISRPME